MKVFRFALALAVALTLLASFAPAQTTRRREVTREAPPPADAVSVDSIVAALYASVTHPPGGSPDFERMRGIFLYVGMLVPPVKPGQEIMGTDIDGFSSRFQKGAAARKEKGEGPDRLLRARDRAAHRLLRQRLPDLLDVRVAPHRLRRQAVRARHQLDPARARREALVDRVGRLGHREAGAADTAAVPAAGQSRVESEC